ncbi:hypothetical protein PMG11_03634 [Penicillium brasilianum]|uniref:Uncharacterized protein n=1 Tax=Penicillium brasilianum TaxID=104259 RepID=A0A0F7VHX8_PENBI|nr:hypothetical protein PMG11_03634 [Penicillium brasilianum]
MSGGGCISSRTHHRLEQAFTKSVLSMSDAQIITGIAIFISGLAQLPCGLSCFEFQILVNLAWFSSLTHLSCLTVLRNYLCNRPVERAWRLLSMLVLVVMLSIALVPTANYAWANSFWADNEVHPPPNLTGPAICFLKPDRQYQTLISLLSSTISIVLISLGYILRTPPTIVIFCEQKRPGKAE